MVYKQLFIFLEGDNDERFFNRIVKPRFEVKYDEIKTIKYSQMKIQKIISFINSIKSMQADYIFVTDINQSPCVSAKKNALKSKFNSLDEDKIIVVIKEIESWYLAGLDEITCKNLKIKHLKDTNHVTKQQFHNLISETNYTELEFRLSILEHFSIETAKRKNNSFNYFCNKYGIS
jgi:hypothetical protein